MNLFSNSDDESIPLQPRSRSYNNNNHNNNNNFNMNNNNNNNQNDDDDYGTFNDINKKLNKSRSIKINKINPMHPKSPLKQPMTTPIRTDKVTGNKYRRLRSLGSIDDTAALSGVPALHYEKEVYSSMNVFEIAPDARNESLHNLWLLDKKTDKSYTPTLTTNVSRSRFSKKDVSDEALHGYQWLGKSSPWREHLTKAAANVWHNQAIALLLLALLVTIVTFIISQMTSFCWGVINYVYTNKMYNKILIFLGCLILKCGFVFAAIFFTITTPQTAGSGIPELKAILSGIWIRKYLSIRGFFIKTLALICALGSGLPIGIEGPVIHISAIIGRQLTKISMFKHIDRKMLLSAACACGIAVIFSAPIGGVLFSIEVTHHYYKINSYWSAFLCATLAALFTTIVQAIAPTTLQLLHTSFTEQAYQTYEFIIFTILGAIAGFMGSSYVQLHRYFTLLRPKIARYHNGFWNNSYVLAGIVTSTYVLCAFVLGEFAFQPSRMAISDLFNAESLRDCSDPSNKCNFTDWGEGLGVYWNLFFFSILNYIFSIWFLVLDWPCGCFASVFAIGASSGRLLGEILNDTIMNWTSTTLLAATYAVVGAASLVGGVTRTFSVAVIVLEMTESVALSIPVLLGVIIAWTIASWLSDSLYDSILKLRGIPLLPITPKHTTNWSVSPIRPFIANDLMVNIREYGYLNDRSSFKEVVLMLEHSNEIFFPVLKLNTRTLLGEVSRQVLEEELKRYGYGKGTEQRFKLIQSALKRLQFIQQNNQNGNNKQIPWNGLNEYYNSDDDNNINNDNDDLISDLMGSVVEDNHFGNNNSHLSSISEPQNKRFQTLINNTDNSSNSTDDDDIKQDISNKKQNKIQKPIKCIKKLQKRKRKWDERGYLKREKEKAEWIKFNEVKWLQHMNISPVTVIPTMPITQIYILFHVLHPDKIYVAKRNELVGVIDEQILLERERLERNGNQNQNKNGRNQNNNNNNNNNTDNNDNNGENDNDNDNADQQHLLYQSPN